MATPRIDGSIESANIPNYEDIYAEDHGLCRCMITKVIYTDNPNNISKGSKNPQVMYEAIIIGGKNDGRVLNNVRDGVKETGGYDNYDETILRPADKPFTVKNPMSAPASEQHGDIVYVIFIQGNITFPIIIGRGTHPLDLNETGATSSDGPRKRSQYNGIFQEINKNGEWQITRKGGTLDSTKNIFTPNKSGNEAQIKFTKNKITRSVVTDKIIETMDGNIEKMTITFKSGMTVTIDGANDNATILSKKGTKLVVDGSVDQVSVVTNAGAEVLVEGTSNTIIAQDSAGGRLKIGSGKVGLGGAPAELLDQISQLLTALQAETHISSAPGFPTTVPVNSATYASIQSLINQIKGGI